MKTKRSLSLIITTALCALAFLFSASDAEAKVIGSIKVTGKVTKNKKRVKTGDEISDGDIIETDDKSKAILFLDKGGEVTVNQGTKLRVFDTASQPMQFSVVYGDIDMRGFENRNPADRPGGANGNDSGAEPLPYLAAFGFGNFSFPAIGGGSSPTAFVVSQTLPNGRVVFLNELGQVLQTQQ